MNLEQFKVFKFQMGRFYVVLFDPRFVNIEEVQDLDLFIGKADVIFIPCEDIDRGMKTVTFDSLEVLEEWVKQMKTTSD